MKTIARRLAKTKQELLLDEGQMFLDKSNFYAKRIQKNFDKYQIEFADYLEGKEDRSRYV